MSSGICIMQTCTAMQLPTSRLGQNKRHCQFENAWILWDAFTNKPLNILQFFFYMCAWSPHLRLMLFCSANWIPLTISGSSGTMANSVTPMKYCKSKKPWRSSAYNPPHAVSWKCSPGIKTPFYNSYTSNFAHLGDGISQKGFDVFGAKVGAAGHQRCGGDQHRESPPTGPVNYMVTWEKRQLLSSLCVSNRSHIPSSAISRLDMHLRLYLPYRACTARLFKHATGSHCRGSSCRFTQNVNPEHAPVESPWRVAAMPALIHKLASRGWPVVTSPVGWAVLVPAWAYWPCAWPAWPSLMWMS